MREQPDIPEEHLRACLHDAYGCRPSTVEFLPRGHDYNAGVYRVACEPGNVCLLKVKAGPLYEAACLVPRFLRDQGITPVVAPVRTRGGALWTETDGWTVTVYPYVEGDTSLTAMTDAQWRETGATFRRIHQVPLPPSGFEVLRQETFDPTTYTRWVRDFEARHLHHHSPRSDAPRPGSDAARVLRACWMERIAIIHTAVNALERLSATLRARNLPRVICHADLHPANLLRDRAGHVHVIDWDDVRLAPKERDFIFVREPQASAFWDGYGPYERDWAAQAYFQWERVVQDLIEYAGQVYFRDDWTEEMRAEVARSFRVNLAEGSANLNAARAATARLPDASAFT